MHYKKVSEFQYISCCYLSKIKTLSRRVSCGFNTSHVVIYQSELIPRANTFNVSIHLMLLFIQVFLRLFYCLCQFQYISCCYLSHLYIIDILLVPTFQYISCCYLSHWLRTGVGEMFVFQYISCCYLSMSQEPLLKDSDSFNTSHVVIYLGCLSYEFFF